MAESSDQLPAPRQANVAENELSVEDAEAMFDSLAEQLSLNPADFRLREAADLRERHIDQFEFEDADYQDGEEETESSRIIRDIEASLTNIEATADATCSAVADLDSALSSRLTALEEDVAALRAQNATIIWLLEQLAKEKTTKGSGVNWKEA
jgi:DUF4097 and DUF4098 domain-containing protein YvlB